MKQEWIEKIIKVPLYPGVIRFIISNDFELCSEKIKNFDDDRGKYVYGHSIWNNDVNDLNTFNLVLNFSHKGHPITHGIISHEALHITQFIAECIGSELNYKDPEPMTYLMNWIVDEVYIFCAENKKKVIVRKDLIIPKV